MATTYPEAGAATVVREHPVMRWGAIFAGWFVAFGVAVLLYVFGLAVGFSAINPWNVDIASRGIPGGAVVWMILTWGAALLIGSMFASWFDGRNDTEMGVVRGLTVWGVSVAATAVLIASGLTHALVIAGAPAEATGMGTVDQAALAHYTAVSMWTAFGCVALSLITSVFGGWIGAHHVHHVYHLRTYAPHIRR